MSTDSSSNGEDVLAEVIGIDSPEAVIAKRFRVGITAGGRAKGGGPVVEDVLNGVRYRAGERGIAAVLADVVEVVLEDAGHGVPEAEAARIAKRLLVRARSAVKQLPAGTGAVAGDAGAPADAIRVDEGEVALVRTVLDRLAGRDDLFVSGLSLVRPLDNGQGVVLDRLTKPAHFANWADRRLVFWDDGKDREVFAPDGAARKVIERGEWDGVQRVVGIANTPVVRADGSIAEADGLDTATGLYLDLPESLSGLGVPETPGVDEVCAAVERVLALYAGFPFEEEADRANAVGLALSVYLKQLWPKMLVPVTCVTAHEQSSGKSLVGMALPGLFAGSRKGLTYTSDEGEIRKLVTTHLLGGGRLLCFDNIAPGTEFESASLAQMLTETEWHDRLLGGNDSAVAAQDRVWSATGNHLRIGPDMAARSVLVRLDPRTPNPAAREFAVRLDDEAALLRMQPELVRAALTWVRGWVLAGMPDAHEGARTMRQFTEWSRRMGGLLAWGGVYGHLGNSAALEVLDDRAASLGALWAALRERFGPAPFLAEHAVSEVVEPRPDLDDALPGWVAEKVVRERFDDPLTAESARRLNRSLGNTFSNNSGRFYGDPGLRMEAAGTTRANQRLWRVRTAEEVESA